jgi:hypothetical protein
VASFDARLGMYELTQGRGMGRALMVAVGVLTAILLSMLLRPRTPSPFTNGGAFGAGHGTQSIMFGANPRAGAPRLR